MTAELFPLVRDLFLPDARRYWRDFLLSIAVFWWSWATLAFQAVHSKTALLACYLCAVLSLYRAACFLHELSHLQRTRVPGFHAAWFFLCGLPLLLPVHLYDSHLAHHRRSSYGTRQDPEYLHGLHQQPMVAVKLLLRTLSAPLQLWIRAAVLVPLAALVPRLRQPLAQRYSSIQLHADYCPSQASTQARSHQKTVSEIVTTLWAWCSAGLYLQGHLPAQALHSFVLIVVAVLLINMLRTALTHRYQSDGVTMDHAGQIADSVTWSGGGVLTALLAPLGLRYHALHHLFPALPFHALATAHARLMQSDSAAARCYQASLKTQAGRPIQPKPPGAHFDFQ